MTPSIYVKLSHGRGKTDSLRLLKSKDTVYLSLPLFYMQDNCLSNVLPFYNICKYLEMDREGSVVGKKNGWVLSYT